MAALADLDIIGASVDPQHRVCPPSRSRVNSEGRHRLALIAAREAFPALTFASPPPSPVCGSFGNAMQTSHSAFIYLLSTTYLPRRHNRISRLPPSPLMPPSTAATASLHGRFFCVCDPWCLTGMSEQGAAVTEAGQSGCGHRSRLPAAGLAVQPLASELL